jgi:hypothetical protein
VILQNCIDLLKVLPGSCNETSHIGVQVINIKTEDLSDLENEEKFPVQISFPVIKTELQVSCICVYIVIHLSQISNTS